jgi:hypothetical protein
MDPAELFEAIDGLIRVGDGPRMAAALAKYLSKAERHIVIIDNYVSEQTIRLAAGVRAGVEITVLSRTFNSDTVTEAAAAKMRESRFA